MATSVVPSYFKALAASASMQTLIDASQPLLEAQSGWRTYLDLGTPQMSLTFETAIGRERIAAAASIVDQDSPAPVRSRNKLERYKGTIPSMKEKFPLNQSQMREIEVLRALNLPNGGSDILVNILLKDLRECAVAGDKRIDIMLYQALSTLTIDVSATNNPDGIALGTIDLLAQSNQKQGVPTVWSDVNATIIDDIEKWIQINMLTRGRMFGKIMMPFEVWVNFKKNTQVKSYLAGFFNTGKSGNSFAVTLSNVNEYMMANGWPMIELINHTAAVETDGVAGFIRPWNQYNVSFVPAGKLGTLYNAIPMELLPQHKIADKTYATFGPTLVSKWAETDPLLEYTGMEMNAFPGINVDGVFILTTNTVQASFT